MFCAFCLAEADSSGPLNRSHSHKFVQNLHNGILQGILISNQWLYWNFDIIIRKLWMVGQGIGWTPERFPGAQNHRGGTTAVEGKIDIFIILFPYLFEFVLRICIWIGRISGLDARFDACQNGQLQRTLNTYSYSRKYGKDFLQNKWHFSLPS